LAPTRSCSTLEAMKCRRQILLHQGSYSSSEVLSEDDASKATEAMYQLCLDGASRCCYF
jgi:hypothetical protein